MYNCGKEANWVKRSFYTAKNSVGIIINKLGFDMVIITKFELYRSGRHPGMEGNFS